MQWSTAYHIHRPIHTITNKKRSRRFTNESLCTCSFSRSFVQWIALKKANATQFHTIILSTKMKKKYKVPLSKALCVHKQYTLAWNSVSVWKSTIFTTTLKLAREIYKYIFHTNTVQSFVQSYTHTHERMIHTSTHRFQVTLIPLELSNVGQLRSNVRSTRNVRVNNKCAVFNRVVSYTNRSIARVVCFGQFS